MNAAAAVPVYGWRSGESAHTAAYLAEPVEAWLRAHGASDVLDAGCGNGALCHLLKQRGYSVVGVDADSAGIAVARNAFPDVRFEVALFADDPKGLDATADGRFDAVVSTEVVEHRYSPHELARFAFDALRPGGIFVITTPYHGFLKNLMLSLTNKWDGHFTAHWHGGHIKFWSRKTLGKLLQDAGFSVTGFQGAGRYPYLWKSMILTAVRPAGDAQQAGAA